MKKFFNLRLMFTWKHFKTCWSWCLPENIWRHWGWCLHESIETYMSLQLNWYDHNMKSIVLCALGVCLCDESQKSYTPPAPLCRDLQCRRPLHSQGNKSIICQLGLAFLQFDNAEVLHVLSVCSEILNLLKAEVFLKCHLELWSQRWVLGVVWRTLFSSLIYSMLIGPSLWQLGPLA